MSATVDAIRALASRGTTLHRTIHPASTGAGTASPEEAEQHVDTPAKVSMTQLALTFLKLGSTSIGGRSAAYLQDELVHRRRWLRIEDWQEGISLGLILPGPVGASCAMFLSNLLRGPRGALLALAIYLTPGLLIALVLSALLFGGPRPPWANGAITALAASAFGLFVYTSLRNLPNSRKTRMGPLFVVLAFLAHGLLGIDLFLVLIGVGIVSLALNRPPARRKE